MSYQWVSSTYNHNIMKLLRILSFVAVFSATSMTSSHVHAELGTLQKTFQEPDAATAEPPAMCRLQTRRQQCTLNHYEDTQKLTQEITEVVLERLRTGVVRDGQPVYVGACGNDYYFSCEDRIRSIVEMVVRESKNSSCGSVGHCSTGLAWNSLQPICSEPPRNSWSDATSSTKLKIQPCSVSSWLWSFPQTMQKTNRILPGTSSSWRCSPDEALNVTM